MTALPFAVNSGAIDSKCRLVLYPVPWRAGSRNLFTGSLEPEVAKAAREGTARHVSSGRKIFPDPVE